MKTIEVLSGGSGKWVAYLPEHRWGKPVAEGHVPWRVWAEPKDALVVVHRQIRRSLRESPGVYKRWIRLGGGQIHRLEVSDEMYKHLEQRVIESETLHSPNQPVQRP